MKLKDEEKDARKEVYGCYKGGHAGKWSVKENIKKRKG